MKKEKVGIGLIGAGLIGTMHSLALKTGIERCDLEADLVHVADVVPEKAEKMKTVFGYAKHSSDSAELLGDPNVDAVYICTWTSEHPKLVLEAASAGKHVFCEKPLAFTAQEAEAMRKAVEKKGLVNQVGLVLRQAPVWNVLRDLVAKVDHGFPIATIFRDDQCFPIKGAHPSEWRRDPEKAGRGSILEHSIHDLDLLEWMFGPASSIRCKTTFRFGHEPIEDMGTADMTFESGMNAALFSIWHDVLNRHSDRRIEIFHEKSFISAESEFTGPISVMMGDGNLQTLSEKEVNERFWDIRGIEDPALQNLSRQFGAYEDYLFVKSVVEGKASDPDFAAAVRVHRLVDACYKAAETGDAVSV